MRLNEVRHAERGSTRPLDGVRVLAVEQMQALPFATQLLAHLGADVVKVEHPTQGESGRGSRPQIADRDGRPVGATYLRNNLGKRSIGIDLKRPAGAALVRRLVPHFDVLAENFKAGAMERMGLGYGALAALHPGLVYVSISGFGHLVPTPYADWPAYAPVVEAMAGLYEPIRRPGEPPPVVVAGALGDNASALYALIGTLAALRQRDRTGRGQHVDIAMFDAMVAMTDIVTNFWSLGVRPEERLAHLVGEPGWCHDPRFATREGWAAHRESVVRPAVEAWARDKTKLEASRLVAAEGIPAGPSNLAPDLFTDPHVAARDMLIEVPRADGAPQPMLVVGNPVKLSAAPEGPLAPMPGLGEHTEAVLREALALDDVELAALRREGVISP